MEKNFSKKFAVSTLFSIVGLALLPFVVGMNPFFKKTTAIVYIVTILVFTIIGIYGYKYLKNLE